MALVRCSEVISVFILPILNWYIKITGREKNHFLYSSEFNFSMISLNIL